MKLPHVVVAEPVEGDLALGRANRFEAQARVPGVTGAEVARDHLAVETEHERHRLLGNRDRAAVRQRRHRHSGRGRGFPVDRPRRPPLHEHQAHPGSRADQFGADAPLPGDQRVRAGCRAGQLFPVECAAPYHIDPGLVRRLLEEAANPLRHGFDVKCSQSGGGPGYGGGDGRDEGTGHRRGARVPGDQHT